MISLFILNYKLLCLGLNFTILMAHFKSKKKLENWEKIIPNQPFISDLYSEKDPIEKKILDLIFSSTQIKSPKETFNLVESDMFSIEEMSSSPVTLNLIKFLLRLIKPKRILEIGTFVGVATMIMAKELGENGKIYTIEKYKKFAELAKRNFKNNKLDKKVNLINRNAEDVLKENQLRNIKFDFIFIDGAKEYYVDFVKFSVNNINKNGIIFVDDALFHGDVLNQKPKSRKGLGVKKSIEYIEDLKNFERVFLPMSNGIVILKKMDGYDFF